MDDVAREEQGKNKFKTKDDCFDVALRSISTCTAIAAELAKNGYWRASY